MRSLLLVAQGFQYCVSRCHSPVGKFQSITGNHIVYRQGIVCLLEVSNCHHKASACSTCMCVVMTTCVKLLVMHTDPVKSGS